MTGWWERTGRYGDESKRIDGRIGTHICSQREKKSNKDPIYIYYRPNNMCCIHANGPVRLSPRWCRHCQRLQTNLRWYIAVSKSRRLYSCVFQCPQCINSLQLLFFLATICCLTSHKQTNTHPAMVSV